MSAEQAEALKVLRSAATLPRSTRQVGAFIAKEFGPRLRKPARGLIALLASAWDWSITSPKSSRAKLALRETPEEALHRELRKNPDSLSDNEAVVFRGRGPSHPSRRGLSVVGRRQARDTWRSNRRAGRQRITSIGAIRPGNRARPAWIEAETDRRDVDDPAAGIRWRRVYSVDGLQSTFSAGQCALIDHAKLVRRMAVPAGLPDQAACLRPIARI